MRAATDLFSFNWLGYRISIPAAHAGCDQPWKHTDHQCFVIFQSPQPMRAATSTLCLMTHMSWNFNPRSPCGLRPAPSDRFNDKLRTYFNPRSPCGLRLIYSPLLPLSRYFNPRSPCGLRRCFFVISSCNIGFQSPQPMRAATDSLGVCFEGDFISIPAAHAGCDLPKNAIDWNT